MGYMQNQDYFFRPEVPPSSNTDRPQPPPLPPRANTASQTPHTEGPPPYAEGAPTYHSQPLTHSWSAQDPRSSSTQSLVPEQSLQDGKRTLLLVFIHGFMGDETSFQSFPAHVHNLLTVKLSETHDVHTKIYPRYKSRKAMEHARDDFSKWLRPHEFTSTDVILVGHSMGGILSAEVALLGLDPFVGGRSNSHRILGTINFDTPFLGMDPRIVSSGISSLFRPSDNGPGTLKEGIEGEAAHQKPMPMPASDDTPLASPAQTASQVNLSESSTAVFPTQSGSSNGQPMSPFLSPTNDPNYDPPFPNDVRIPTRGKLANALHFINKHSDGLTKATKSYVTSYFEFGGCMADYTGLKDRYTRLRALESVNARRDPGQRRVRYVNYYTASTGRPKKPKPRSRSGSPAEREAEPADCVSDGHEDQSVDQELQHPKKIDPKTTCRSTSPPIKGVEAGEALSNVSKSKEAPLNDHSIESWSDDPSQADSNLAMNTMEPAPILEDEHHHSANKDKTQYAGEAEISTKDNPELVLSRSGEAASVNLQGQGENDSLNSGSLPRSPSLPPIPPQPGEPAPFDPSLYQEKDARKLAEKEHSRRLKTYQRTVKDRDQAIKDRRKLVEKREKTAKLTREKQLKQEEKEIAKTKKEDEKKSAKIAKPSKTSSEPENAAKDDTRKTDKPKRDKRFCMLPPKINGEIDPCWIRVYMRDVDEVGAHCGLFFVGEHYERLVNDVGERIRSWVEQGRSE